MSENQNTNQTTTRQPNTQSVQPNAQSRPQTVQPNNQSVQPNAQPRPQTVQPNNQSVQPNAQPRPQTAQPNNQSVQPNAQPRPQTAQPNAQSVQPNAQQTQSNNQTSDDDITSHLDTSIEDDGATASINENTDTQSENSDEEEANAAEVNETQDNDNAETVNKDINFDTLSVDEQQEYLHILEEKDKRGLLSVSEKAILNEQTDNNDKYVGDFGTDNRDENEDPDLEKKGPFKEKDVIKYMYEDWLLEGANWLWCKTASKIDKGTYWAQKKILDHIAENRLKKGKTYESEQQYDQMANHAVSLGQANMDSIKKHEEAQLKNLQLLKEGKYDEANVSNLTKLMFKNMDKKEKEQFFKISEQGIKNYYDNFAMAEQFGSNYAQAGMTFDLATDKDFYKGKDIKKEFEQQKAKAMKKFFNLIDAAQKKGKDPRKVATELFEESKKALKASQENMEDRHISELGKKPNKDLAKYITSLSNKLKEAPEEQGMYSAALNNKNFDFGIQQTQDNLNKAFVANLDKKANNDEKRAKVNKLKEDLGLTNQNINSTEFDRVQADLRKKERNQHAADTLSGMAALGGYMGGGRS